MGLDAFYNLLRSDPLPLRIRSIEQPADLAFFQRHEGIVPIDRPVGIALHVSEEEQVLPLFKTVVGAGWPLSSIERDPLRGLLPKSTCSTSIWAK